MANIFERRLRGLGFDHLYLGSKGYRGAIKAYESEIDDMPDIPVYFYRDIIMTLVDKDGNPYTMSEVRDFFMFRYRLLTLDTIADLENINDLVILGLYYEDNSLVFDESMLTKLGLNYARFRGDVLLCVQSIMSYMREVEYPLYPPEALPVPAENRFDSATAVEADSGAFHKVVRFPRETDSVPDVPEFVPKSEQ